MKANTKKKIRISIFIVLIVIIISMGSFYIYTLDYYRADNDAIQVVTAESKDLDILGNITIFYPKDQIDTHSAMIFYPGGKVEAIAYAPLLSKLSSTGITTILVKMPFNLAVFNINAADNVLSKLPEIKNWYIAGHSLGGAMASSYIEKNEDKFQGLILLGAYPVNESSIPTLAIYGTYDLGLDKSKLESVENKFEIIGGNHAYYGNYGEQEGDGVATITREEQQAKAVELIIEFMNNNSLK
ncbi:MAG: alpha/beta hydrolase [Gudongella sp.]|nr:alpha/beta hydrolase [Gudongella sp.]